MKTLFALSLGLFSSAALADQTALPPLGTVPQPTPPQTFNITLTAQEIQAISQVGLNCSQAQLIWAQKLLTVKPAQPLPVVEPAPEPKEPPK